MNEHDGSDGDRRQPGDPGHLLVGDPPVGRRTRAPRRWVRAAFVAVAAVALVTAGAGAWAYAGPSSSASETSASAGRTAPSAPGWPTDGDGAESDPTAGDGMSGLGSGSGGPLGGFGAPGGGFGAPGGGFGAPGGTDQDGQGSTGTSEELQGVAATDDQIQGVVTIVSELGYGSAASAGTGIVLTASGRVLTNNHVIDGATAIEVTDESTGESYTAQVVGTDATHDVAVLQLEDATGLATAAIATEEVAVGDAVTAVGNAGGTGTLAAAAGGVTALDATITTRSEGTAEGETLQGLIEIDADVVSGDSGGPLQNADGEVVGIDTAASSGSADITAYAIPIDDALEITDSVVAGDDTAAITIGLPAFLGVSLSADAAGTEGAVVASVLDGMAAATAGLAAGDVITAVGGRSVSSGDDLSAAIAAHEPGDSVEVTVTDVDGSAQTVQVVLQEGPAD